MRFHQSWHILLIKRHLKLQRGHSRRKVLGQEEASAAEQLRSVGAAACCLVTCCGTACCSQDALRHRGGRVLHRPQLETVGKKCPE